MSDDEELLSLLKIHGSTFLGSFSLPPIVESRLANKPLRDVTPAQSSDSEWDGITTGSDPETRETDIPTISFHDSTAATRNSAETKETFMSSKVVKVHETPHPARGSSQATPEDKLESSHARNDALLHQLVQNELFSKPVNREKAHISHQKSIAARLLELSGEARTGHGERSSRKQEINKASKNVRDGLVRKAKKKEKADLEAIKDMGNYHHSVKHLFQDRLPPVKRKRDSGMRMGIGRFESGVLRLEKREVKNALESFSRSRRAK